MAKLGILPQGSVVCQSEKRNSQNRKKTTAARFPPNPRTHYVETDQVSNFTDELHLFAIGSSSKPQPIKCKALIEGKPNTMEFDTGAEVSLISEGTRESLFSLMQPAQSSIILKTYTVEVMPVVGELQVNVQYGEQTKRLRLIILLLALDPVSCAEIGYNILN